MTETRQPVWKILSILCLSLLFVLSSNLMVSAENQEDIGFYVRAVIPENQVNRKNTFFDLRMTPSQQQTITVETGNSTDEPIRLAIAVNSAYTNALGGIDYQGEHTPDENMVYKIEDIVTPSFDEIVVAPHSIAEIQLQINMPEQFYDGQLLGGIVITKVDERQENTDDSLSLNNVYSYVIGLMLTETDVELKPELGLITVQPQLVNYRTAIVHSIRNSAPFLMKDALMSISIYPEGASDPVWSTQQDNLKMAPSSLMDYTFYLEDETIQSGDYLSKVQINWRDQQWDFEQPFSIAPEEAKEINNGSLSSAGRSTLPPLVLIALAGLLLLIFVLLLVLAIRLYLKNKEQDES